MSGPKIEYYRHDGGTSKAYLDHDEPINGLYYGTNKHTDLPVIVAWVPVGWVEVCEFIGPLPNWMEW